MADSKTTALTELTAFDGDETFYVVDDDDGTPVSKRVTIENLTTEVTDGIADAIADGDASTLTSAQAYAVPKATLDANTILYATTDDTPAALAVAASRIVGRKSSGDIAALTGAEAGDLIGVYQAYTPTIAQNGARTTSTLSGRYMQIGKHVHAYGNATISNTGTAGNVLTTTVPVTASGGYGHGTFYDASTTAQYTCHMVFQSGTTIGWYITGTAGEVAVGNNPNIAVANGDKVTWNIVYEAA